MDDVVVDLDDDYEVIGRTYNFLLFSLFVSFIASFGELRAHLVSL